MKKLSHIFVPIVVMCLALPMANARAAWAAGIIDHIDACTNCRLRVKFVLAVDDIEDYSEADDGWAFVTRAFPSQLILVRTQGSAWFKTIDRLSETRWGHLEWSPFYSNIVGGERYTFHSHEDFSLFEYDPYNITNVSESYTKTVPIDACGLGT